MQIQTMLDVDRFVDALPFAAQRIEARYVVGERLGMLCEDRHPTEKDVAIVAEQLKTTKFEE